MPVADAPTRAPTCGARSQSLRRQRGGWSLTVVTPEDRLPEIQKLVQACTSLRDRRRVPVLGGRAVRLASVNSSESGSRPVMVCRGR